MAGLTADARGREEGLGRVARAGALNLAAAAAGAVLNVGIVVVVTRSFPQETAGLFFSATSVFLILAAVANLGAANGLVYFIARVRAQGAADLVPHLLRVALGPVAAGSLLLGGVLLATAPVLAELLGTPEAAAYLRLLALFLPCAVMADTALAATRGFREMRATALLDKASRPLAQLALLAGVAASGAAGLLTVAWAGPYLPTALLAGAWLWWILRRGCGEPAGPLSDPAPGGKVGAAVFWAFALPRSVANIAQIGLQHAGIILAALLAGAAEAALLAAALRFAVAGRFTTQAVQLAAQPRLAELLAVGDRRGANALYQAGTTWLICLTWPMYLSALVFAPVLMDLFGPDYREGAAVLVIVAAAMLAATACGMSDLTLAMAGRTRWNLGNNVAALALNAGLCWLLIPHFGALGAASAWAAGLAARNLLAVVQLRGMGLSPWDRAAPAAMGVCAAWFGPVSVAAAALLGWGPPALTAAVVAAGLGYAATLWRLRRLMRMEALRLR